MSVSRVCAPQHVVDNGDGRESKRCFRWYEVYEVYRRTCKTLDESAKLCSLAPIFYGTHPIPVRRYQAQLT